MAKAAILILMLIVFTRLALPAEQQPRQAKHQCQKPNSISSVESQVNAGTDKKSETHSPQNPIVDLLLKPSLTDWLLAGFSLALVIIGRHQFQAMKSTLQETARSADAAKTSADIAARTFDNIERPYVFLTPGQTLHDRVGQKLIPYTSIGEPPFTLCWNYICANSGRTPAILSRITWQYYDQLSSDNRVPGSPKEAFGSGRVKFITRVLGTIGEDSVHRETEWIELKTIQDMPTLEKHRMAWDCLVLTVQIEYWDAVHTDDIHIVEQAFSYDFNTQDWRRYGDQNWNRHYKVKRSSPQS